MFASQVARGQDLVKRKTNLAWRFTGRPVESECPTFVRPSRAVLVDAGLERHPQVELRLNLLLNFLDEGRHDCKCVFPRLRTENNRLDGTTVHKGPRCGGTCRPGIRRIEEERFTIGNMVNSQIHIHEGKIWEIWKNFLVATGGEQGPTAGVGSDGEALGPTCSADLGCIPAR